MLKNGGLLKYIYNTIVCGCSQKNIAVIFDMDGVIFDSEKLSLICWNILAEKLNLKNIENVFFECIGASVLEAEQKFNIAYKNKHNFKDFKREKTELYKQMYENGKLCLKPGVIEILLFLKERGIKIGLATSTKAAVVNRELEDYNIKQYFDVIICGDMVEKCKPSPDVYLKACDALECKPEFCYAIEDSYNGIIAAKRARTNVIMVPDLVQGDDLEDKSSVIIMQSLFDVIDYLKSVLNGEKLNE